MSKPSYVILLDRIEELEAELTRYKHSHQIIGIELRQLYGGGEHPDAIRCPCNDCLQTLTRSFGTPAGPAQT
jgi:hypothetical protein